MPRLRRARTPEEALAVPADKPLVVQLADENTVEVPEEPTDETKKVEAAPIAPEPEVEEDESPLQKRVEELQRAEASWRERDQRQAAEIARLQREQRSVQEERERLALDNATNGLAASQEAADRAQTDLENAIASGDTKAQAEAHRRLSVAAGRIDRWEEEKARLEAQAEETKKRPQEPAAQDFEARIRDLPEVGKTWLRARPEFINDASKNAQIVAAHSYITEIERRPAWTPEYFQSLETHLGIRRTESTPQPERRSPPVSAPVSRETPNLSTGRPQRREITLSPEQREAAKIAGVDDFTYAKGVQELERRKKLGMYPDR